MTKDNNNLACVKIQKYFQHAYFILLVDYLALVTMSF